MGLRCSILGHTFDETEVRRDRRERGSGNEVVTVVSQVERCSRCGTERVVSENKEVVSVVDAAEVGLDEEGEGDATTGEVPPADRVSHDARESGTDTGAALAGDASEETDAGIDDEPGRRAREEAESGVADGTDETDGTDPSGDPDPAEEDVEFITETEGALGGGEDVAEDVPSDAGESAGGIGGMAARSGAFDGSDDPDAESGGTGAGDESVGDDAEILDAPETERAPGQWPDEPDEDEPWEPDALDEDEDEEEGPGATADPAPDVEPVAESSFTVPEGSLRCPDCGHEVSADSSFRAGDACPECQGYLEDAE
jgi:hypothetical protein